MKIHPTEFQLINIITLNILFKMEKKKCASQMTDTEWLNKLKRTLNEFIHKLINMTLFFIYIKSEICFVMQHS